MKRIAPGQLNIPVPNQVGFQHDPDAVFAREYGDEALAEQQRRYREERACNCKSPFPDKWGVKNKHTPGCPRAGRRF